MSALLKPFLERWRLTALVASLAMLATAHAFETFGGLAPCALCLRAREVYWVAAGLALAGMLVTRMRAGARWRWVFDAALAAVFAFNANLLPLVFPRLPGSRLWARWRRRAFTSWRGGARPASLQAGGIFSIR